MVDLSALLLKIDGFFLRFSLCLKTDRADGVSLFIRPIYKVSSASLNLFGTTFNGVRSGASLLGVFVTTSC